MEKKYILKRDRCKECLRLKKEGRKHMSGDQVYCSQLHDLELAKIKRMERIMAFREEVFDKIYELGENKVKDKKKIMEAKELIIRLEKTWY